jgi:chemotaxis signal transduction protein
VSAPAIAASEIERLLTFEVSTVLYALPIAEVHEVVEVRKICCVPTIPRACVGILNWNGDALPVVAARLLLEPASRDEHDASEGIDADQPTGLWGLDGQSGADASTGSNLDVSHVLIVSGRDDEPARLALPVDRVLGLVDGPHRRRGGRRLIVERRPLEGRVVNVLDPRRLVEGAAEVIGRLVA